MLTVLQIALTNLVLSSDNVLVIALLSHGVHPAGRRHALAWSLVASVTLQLGILLVLALLFHFTVLQAAFGAVICFMAVQLLQTHAAHHPGDADRRRVPGAVVRITGANLLMSFENEAALIGIAHGNAWLAWTGLLLTAPVIFLGSHALVEVLRRYPVIVYAGALYLFWVGARLLFAAGPWRPYATAGTWALTALFALYLAARLRATL